MTLQDSKTVAFSMPGGESSATGSERPIDLAHLSRQTMGDRALEQEVLELFVQQAVQVREDISKVGLKERIRLAHGLKGSARGVGAFALADCVDAIEREPSDEAAIARLAGLVDEVREFIASIGR